MRKTEIVFLLIGGLLFLLSGCQGTVSKEPVIISPPEQEDEVDRGKEQETVEAEQPEPEEDELPDIEITEPEPEPEPELEPEKVEDKLTRADLIEQRLNFYREKLGNWERLDAKLNNQNLAAVEQEDWQQCTFLFQDMVKDYELFSQTATSDAASLDKAGVWNILAEDFAALRSGEPGGEGLFSSLEKSPAIKKCRTLMIQGAADLIQHYAGRKQYDKAVDSYEFIETFLVEAEISPEIRVSYGRALLEKGRLDEAVAAFMEALAEDSEKCSRSLALRRESIESLIALGDFDQARLQLDEIDDIRSSCMDTGKEAERYDKLLESSYRELKLYSEALRSWLASDKREIPRVLTKKVSELRQFYPGSQAAELGMLLEKQAENRVERYVYQELSRAVELVKEGNFNSALEIAGNLNGLDVPEELQQKIKDTESAIRKKQAREKLRQERLREQTLTARWNKAVDSLDHKEYDEALEQFRSLLDTDYREQAGKKIRETIRLAAASKREKAAELFIQGRDAEDEKTRIDYLQRSRQLLLDILEKYPEAGIVNKVEKHLKVVEDTLMEIDPALLEKEEKQESKDQELDDGWF